MTFFLRSVFKPNILFNTPNDEEDTIKGKKISEKHFMDKLLKSEENLLFNTVSVTSDISILKNLINIKFEIL